jgi:hypothetical protein
VAFSRGRTKSGGLMPRTLRRRSVHDAVRASGTVMAVPFNACRRPGCRRRRSCRAARRRTNRISSARPRPHTPPISVYRSAPRAAPSASWSGFAARAGCNAYRRPKRDAVTRQQGEKRPSCTRRRMARSTRNAPIRTACLRGSETRLLRDLRVVGRYVDAVAGVRRHSIAASPTITMVTTNRPTTIIRSTDPSC